MKNNIRIGYNDCHAWAKTCASNFAANGFKAKILSFNGTLNGGIVNHSIVLLYSDEWIKWADNQLSDDPATDPKILIKKFKDVSGLGTYGLRQNPNYSDNTEATGIKIANALFADFWNRGKPNISKAKFFPPQKLKTK